MCDRRNITPPQGDALRKRVEEAFRGKPTRMPGTSEALSLDEIRRLFNELQVYQVELEMQNEDLRRSQGELEATRERYFDLYDLAPVGYFTLSEQEVILEANLAAAGLLGVSRGDLVKQPLARFILPEDQNIYYRHRQQLLATGAPQVCEMRMLRKDAAPFWARIQANRETDPDGAAVCRAVLSDITDQKRAEEALQELQTGLEERVRERTRTLAESEERFRMMVEEVKDYAIIMLDAEGRIVSWNAGAERIKGYRADEIVGRHFSQFYPREDMESGKPERALANAIAEGRFEEEGWRVRKDGSLFFAGVIITALRDDAGGLRGFTKITRDITEQKQAEIKIKEVNERFNRLVSLLNEVVWTASIDGSQIIDVNKSIENIYGISVEEFQANPKLWVEMVHPDDRAIAEASGKELYEKGKTQAEYRIVKPDGTVVWLLDSKSLFYDETSTQVQMGGIAKDITERKKAEDSLRGSQELFRKTLELGVVGMATTHPYTYHFLSANRHLCEMIGYTEEELLQKTWVEITFPKEKVDEDAANLAELLSGELNGYVMEKQYQHKDGHMIDITLSVQGVRNKDGTIDYILILVDDITERKNVEREIRQLNANLEGLIVERTAALRIKNKAFDEGITANSIANAEGVIIEANQAFLKMWGCAEMTEVIGKPIGAFLQKSADAERIIAALDGVGTWKGDYTALRKDDSTFTAHGLGTALRDVNGGIMGYQSSVIDITERNRVEQELRERTAALAAFNQVMMGREARIVELKEEIGRLRAKSGKESPAGAPNGASSDFDSPGSAERRTEEEAPPASSAIPLSEPADMAAPAGKSSRMRWFAALVLLVSLLVTAAVYHAKNSEEMNLAQERFEFRVNTFQAALQARLMAYQSMLRGSAALFDASGVVTRREWRDYVEAIRIGKEYPGVQGVGFSQRILPAEKEAHLRRIRREGFPGYAVRPEGERPEYTSIIFLEPFNEQNQRAFGYDMFFEPARRLAMTRARDTGRPALSGKVTLMQETEKDVQAGFLMYLPVYRPGKALSTPELRREALAGYVYSPFRMNDFIEGISVKDAREIEVEIHDGKEAQPETLMYRSSVGSLREHDHPHRLTRQTTIEFGGHRWLLTFASSPSFESANMPGRANFILRLGIVISLLLSGMVLFFDRSYRQALALGKMNIEIRKANDQLTAEAARRKRSEEEAQRRLAELTRTHDVMIGRENRFIELKEEVNRLSAEIGREPPYPEFWRIAGKETDGPAPAAVEEAPS
jgi:PAS domain S-box-containing protein